MTKIFSTFTEFFSKFNEPMWKDEDWLIVILKDQVKFVFITVEIKLVAAWVEVL